MLLQASRRLACCVSLAVLCLPISAMLMAQAKDPAKPVERITIEADKEIGDGITRYFDPEIDEETGLIAFYDGTDRVKVGKLNKSNGQFTNQAYEDLGQGASRYLTYNGPEFGYSQKGLGIYYTGIDEKGFYHNFRYRNKTLTQLDKGNYYIVANYPSKNPASPECFVMGGYFSDSRGGIFNLLGDKKPFRLFNETTPDSQQTFTMAKIGKGPRFIGTTNNVVTNLVDAKGVVQTAIYNPTTKITTQITFDGDNKQSATFFKAPELNNELLIQATLEGGKAIRIYRQLNGKWTAINNLPAPSGMTFGNQTEAFTYKGKSFVTAIANGQTRNLRKVYMLSIDGRFKLPISGNEIQAAEGEAVVFDKQLYIYYYGIDTNKLFMAKVTIPDTILNP